jgi:uncharacterized protein YkwD
MRLTRPGRALFGVLFSAASAVSAANAFAGSVEDLLWSTNEARARFQLPSFELNQQLQNAARSHASDMAARSYFSHSTPEGWSPGFRAAGWGYRGGVGENLACGYTSASAVVEAWLASPGHRANLLNPYARTFGVGHYYKPDSPCVQYWVGLYGF